MKHPALDETPDQPAASLSRTIVRLLLGLAMTFAGVMHLTLARQDFQAQVPSWIPFSEDLVVLVSGVVEIAFGLALLLLPRGRWCVGIALAVFYVLIFPGNIGQYLEAVDAFGLDTDRERLIRLLVRPDLPGPSGV